MAKFNPFQRISQAPTNPHPAAPVRAFDVADLYRGPVEAEISPPTDQADQKLQQMLQAGSGVDVLEVRDLTVGPFSNNGWLYDMSADLKEWDGLDKLTDQAKAVAIDSEGKSYFVPYGFYGLSLFYRTDLVKEADERIKKLVRMERSPGRIRHYLHRLGMKPRKTGQVPSKADPVKQLQYHDEVIQPLLCKAQKGACHVLFMDSKSE